MTAVLLKLYEYFIEIGSTATKNISFQNTCRHAGLWDGITRRVVLPCAQQPCLQVS